MCIRILQQQTVAVICLIAIMQLPFAVTHLSHYIRKSAVRYEVHKKMNLGIKQDEVTVLTFSKKDIHLLRWEHDREFEYKQMMYDIIKITEKGDSISYYCWADFEESALNDEIENMVEATCNSDPVERHHKQVHWDYFKNIFFQTAGIDKNHIRSSQTFSTSLTILFLLPSNEIFITLLYPPPEIYLS